MSQFDRVVTCPQCALQFQLPFAIYDARLADKKYFWCPNGHQTYFQGKTEVQELKEKIEKLERSLKYTSEMRQYWHDEHEKMKRSRDALRGVITKMRKRAQGVVTDGGD